MGEPEEARGAPSAAAPVTVEQPETPEKAPRRPWSTPTSPVTRKQVDEMRVIALQAVKAIARFVGDVTRLGARAVLHVWRAIHAVPPALQLFVCAGLCMLFGVVGAITLHGTVGLMCIVVVIPVCSATLGVLGYRWYSGIDADSVRRADTQTVKPATADLQRSIQYVDTKLAHALTSFGTEHHQQAVIALFQAKTAVELTLGTEHDGASFMDVPLRVGDHRPRIRAGAGSTSALRESNSLAAS